MQPNSLGIRGAGQGLQFAIVGSNFDTLGDAAEALVAQMEENPAFGQVRVSYETTQPQLFIEVDRERASDLGIDIDGLGETLQAVLDGRSVGSVFIDDRSYDIKLTSTDRPGARPDRPREPVPRRPRSRRDGADVDGGHARGAADRARARRARARCAR